MAVVHFTVGGLIPVKSRTVPGGISVLDVPDRIAGRIRGIFLRPSRTAVSPPRNQQQKQEQQKGGESACSGSGVHSCAERGVCIQSQAVENKKDPTDQSRNPE